MVWVSLETGGIHVIIEPLTRLHAPAPPIPPLLQDVPRIKQAAEAEGAAQTETSAKAGSGREPAAEELAASEVAEAEAHRAVKDAKIKGEWVGGWVGGRVHT
jgi:hypothetical protein